MNIEEAKAWLRGERSMTNVVYGLTEDRAHEIACVARADAAMTEQAYWILKAHQDGLFLPKEPA